MDDNNETAGAAGDAGEDTTPAGEAMGDDGVGGDGFADGFDDGAAGGGAFADAAALHVDPAPYPDLNGLQPTPGEPRDLRLLSDIELELCVEIGRARLPLRQLLALTPGSVVELDRALGEPVDVLVNGKLVARGQIVTIADEFGVRLSEIVDPAAATTSRRR
ncbi:MAG: flagellar motor switch protein FliN [Acidimicrobiales bacterium]